MVLENKLKITNSVELAKAEELTIAITMRGIRRLRWKNYRYDRNDGKNPIIFVFKEH